MKKVITFLMVGCLSYFLLLTGCSGNDKKPAAALSTTADAGLDETSGNSKSDADKNNSDIDGQVDPMADQNIPETEPALSYPGQVEVDLNAPRNEPPIETTIKAGREAALTAETYKSITLGMSYDEVAAIMGTDGEINSETDENGIKSMMCIWVSSDTSMYATLTFVDDHVSSKSQTGVFGVPEAKIDSTKYDKVQLGMSYEDIVAIIGGEGAPLSESVIDGVFSQSYFWYTGDGMGHARITMSGGTVVSKVELGIIPLVPNS